MDNQIGGLRKSPVVAVKLPKVAAVDKLTWITGFREKRRVLKPQYEPYRQKKNNNWYYNFGVE